MLLLLVSAVAFATPGLDDLPPPLLAELPAAGMALARAQLAAMEGEGRALDRGCVHLTVDGVYDSFEVSVEHTLSASGVRDTLKLTDTPSGRWRTAEQATVDADGHDREVTVSVNGEVSSRRSERWQDGLRVERVEQIGEAALSRRVERWTYDSEGRERAYRSDYREGPMRSHVGERITYTAAGPRRVVVRTQPHFKLRCVTTSTPAERGRVEHTDCGDDDAPVTRTLRWDDAGHLLLDDRRSPFGDGSGDEIRSWSWTWADGHVVASHREAPFVGERDMTWFWAGERLVGRSEPGPDIVAVGAWWGACPAWPLPPPPTADRMDRP